MADYDFSQLQAHITNVNNAVNILSGNASLLGSVQQEALKDISALAQEYQQLQAELEAKNAKIAELEGELANLKNMGASDMPCAETGNEVSA